MLPVLRGGWTPETLWDLLRSHFHRLLRFVLAGVVAALKTGYQHPALVGAAALLIRLWSSSKQLDPLQGAAACAGHSPGLPGDARSDILSHAAAAKASMRVARDDVSEHSSVETHIIHSDVEEDEASNLSNATSRVSWATSRASQKRNRRARPAHQYAEAYTKSWAVEEENRNVLNDFKLRTTQQWYESRDNRWAASIAEDTDLESLVPSASCSRRTSPEKLLISRAKPSVICIHADPDSDPIDLFNAIQDYSLKRERIAKVDSAAPVDARKRSSKTSPAKAQQNAAVSKAQRGRHGRRRHGRVACA
jgi:hypothetical protein